MKPQPFDKKPRKIIGQRCCLCKKNDSHRSFFKFPKDENLYARWIAFCALPRFEIYKTSKLCSDHFELNHMIQCKGRFKLRENAVPTVNHPKRREIPIEVMLEEAQFSSIYDESIESNEEPISTTEFNLAQSSNSPNEANVDSPQEIEFVEIEMDESHFLPSSDKTDETFMLNGKSALDAESFILPSKKSDKPEFRPPMYLNRIGIKHLSTPRHAEACFDMIKQIVSKKNKKIKILKQQNQRLQVKMTSLKETLRRLRRERRKRLKG